MKTTNPTHPLRSTLRVLLPTLLGCLLMPARAALFMDVGTHLLQPGTAGQQIQLLYSSDFASSVAGLDFNVQIADGGPDAGGSISGPSITAVDIVTGTLFDGLGPNVSADLELPQIQVHSLDLNANTTAPVSVPILLATVTLDTTGFNTPGLTWDLRLGGTLNGDTALLDGNATAIPFEIINGTIEIATLEIPEPGEYALVLGLAGIGAALFRRLERGRFRMDRLKG